MKKIIFLLLITIAAAYVAFGQCNYLQIGYGVGVHAVDSQMIAESHPRCTPCPTQGVVSWDLVGAIDWQIFINSDDTSIVTIQITRDCDFLLFDTCVSLPPPYMPAVWSFSKQFSVFDDAQIHISGKLGQTIYADIKGTANHSEELDFAIIDLSTCDAPLSVLQPTEQSKFTYFDPITLEKVVHLEPNKAYLRRK